MFIGATFHDWTFNLNAQQNKHPLEETKEISTKRRAIYESHEE